MVHLANRMSLQLRISAKNLGTVALDGFCPRCFWLHLHSEIPYQIFPGIFSSIDSYTKKNVHGYFDSQGKPPAWLNIVGDLKGYIPPPTYHKFKFVDEETNILLTGSVDGVFVRGDGSHIIVDYKTAKYTGAQDALYKEYEAQLNGYALIGEKTGMISPVSALALIYMEPVTDDGAAANNINLRQDGFAMGFKATIHKVTLDTNIIPPLLRKVREIYDLPSLPNGIEGCKDCDAVDQLTGYVRG